MPDLLARLEAALADRYRVDREIGRGGMAHVFLAHDLKLDRPVALKVLRPDLAAVLGGQRFLREITLAAKLEHPHILAIHDSGEADGILYYVMPYVEGESLRDRLRREKQLPLDDALQISREVADALSYAHSHGVIHRDIKPENILLESGHAVVADFGIARAIDAAGADRLTETGVAMGTPAYMSPEQAGGSRDLDGRSDLYSLGCVLYEMLAGEPPFTGPTVESLVRQHLAAEPPSITNIRPSVPSWVVAALQRALAKTPADRFNPVAQFGEAIAPRISTAEPSPPSSRKLDRRWLVPTVGIAGLMVAAVAVAARFGVFSAEEAVPVSARPYTIVAGVDGTADPDVRATVRAILSAALDDSRIIQPLPEDQIERGLQLAGRSDTTALDQALARELAVRGAIRTVVAGSVDRAGDTYHVAVRVVDADSGITLASARDAARGEDDVIGTVDRLIRNIREQLGERPEALAPTRPFAEVATPSFAAYRHYVAGGARFRAFDYPGAMWQWEQTITLDPAFAGAWMSLSTLHQNRGDRAKAREALDSAFAHADRLTESQRSTLAIRRARLADDRATEANLLRRHSDLYGPSEWTLGSRANALAGMGRIEEAISVLEGLERSPPPFGVQAQLHWNLAGLLSELGRIEEAWQELHHITGTAVTRMGAIIAVAAGDWARADTLATSALRAAEDARQRWIPLQLLANVSATRGQVGRALERLREVASTDTTQLRERAHRMYGAMLTLAVVSGVTLNPGELHAIRTDTAPGATLLALWTAASGDTAAARTRLASARALPPEQRARFDTALVLAEALIAGQTGQADSAIELLRPVVNGWHGWDPPVNQLMRWTLAHAFEHVGQRDSAAAWLQRIAQWGGQLWGADGELRGLTYSFVHFKLGRLYAQLGRYDEAKGHYGTFLGTFTQPDPEYEWMVSEARTELEKLAGGR